MTEYDYFNQPYVAELLRAIPRRAGITHQVVAHDEWCPLLHGTGLCVCNAIVRQPNRQERRQLAARKRR